MIPDTLAQPGAVGFWLAVLLTGFGAGVSAVGLTLLLEAVQHLMWPGPGTLLEAATRGLRAADDPRIPDTAKVVDALLKVETPSGFAWHCYNDDGYGEHEDGAPFDGTGISRVWPLITGERAHYELLAAAWKVHDASWPHWKTSSTKVALSRSKFGIRRTCPNASCILVGLLVQPCRGCGRAPNISSCAARLTMGGSSIYPRKRCSAIWSTK